MFNVRPNRRWLGFSVGLPDDIPEFRVGDDGLPLPGMAPRPMPSSLWGDVQTREELSMSDMLLRTGGPIGPYTLPGISDRFAGNPYWSPERGSINSIEPAGYGSLFAPVARPPRGGGDPQINVPKPVLADAGMLGGHRSPNALSSPEPLLPVSYGSPFGSVAPGMLSQRSGRPVDHAFQYTSGLKFATPSPSQWSQLAEWKNQPTQFDRSPGEIVVLPDGSTIADVESPTGYVMSPKADLRDVASRGRRIGETYRAMLANPATGPGALLYLAAALGLDLGQGGTYDHQRRGNMITGYTQLRQFRPIANINVGLLGQQAGLALEEILGIAGAYARLRSSNADPGGLYRLDRRTLHYITRGYEIGQSGTFDSTDRR